MINYPNGKKYTVTQTTLEMPKKNKYSAVKTECDDITFDSKKEASRYKELKLLEHSGVIKNLRLQVPFELIAKSKYGVPIRYIADFVYEENAALIVEDTKGVRTPMYKLKKRLLAEKYEIEIKET